MSAAAGGTGSGTVAAGGSKWLVLAAMMTAVSMTFIDQTIVSIAVPSIQSELGLSDTGVQWVVNGYLLALSALFALGGRLSDILGHRRMVLIGIVVFAGASLLCGLTPATSAAEAWLIVFRAVQGAGAALMFPAALAVVVASFAVGERGKALAVFFGVTGALTAIGPIAGGYLSAWTWRAIFWVNIPVAVVAVILTAVARVTTPHRREPIDYRGAVLVALGMGLSVLGFQQSSTWGWGSAATWACIVVGAAVLVVFVLVELRTDHPLIQVRIFRDRAFAVDSGVLFFSMTAFVPVFLFASIYSQVSLGYDADNAGLYLMVFFAGFATAAQVGGRVLDRRGAKQVVVLGCAVATVGYVLWGRSLTTLDFTSQWYFIVVAGAGIGLLLGPVSTDAVNRAIGASYGEVTGITQTVRNYGSSLGVAILGTLLVTTNTDKVTATLTGVGVPPAQAASLAQNLSQSSGSVGSDPPAGVSPEEFAQLKAAVQLDFAQSMQLVFYGMAVALALSLVVALLHPGGRVTAPTAGDPAPVPAGD